MRRDGAPGRRLWPDLQAISAGGGLSIPYREGEEAIDTAHYYGLWNRAREQIAAHLGHPVKLEIEPTLPVAESGVLVSQVRSVKEMGSRHFVLIDAGFNDLMRPAMYGSYHHITALAGMAGISAPRRRSKPWWPGRCANPGMSLPSRRGKVETRLLPAVAPGIIWCSMTPAPTGLRCRPTITAVRCCRRCCLMAVRRG